MSALVEKLLVQIETALNRLSGKKGTIPLQSGTVRLSNPIIGADIKTTTTFTAFYNENNIIVVTGWEGIVIPENTTIWFNTKIYGYTTSTAGFAVLYLD